MTLDKETKDSLAELEVWGCRADNGRGHPFGKPV